MTKLYTDEAELYDIAFGWDISGFDLSPPMIALARERLGADADLAVADMTCSPEQDL